MIIIIIIIIIIIKIIIIIIIIIIAIIITYSIGLQHIMDGTWTQSIYINRHTSKPGGVVSVVVSMFASVSKGCGFSSHTQRTVTVSNRAMLVRSCR